MNTNWIVKIALATFTTVLLATVICEPAFADRGHPRARIGVYIGGPGYYYYPWWYAPYYYPPAVVERQPDVTYIEQEPAQTVPENEQPGFWYYCADAKVYFPYVKQCPGGWQRVVPQAPAAK